MSTALQPRTGLRLAVLLAYTALLAIALWRHAMWRDEMQAWLIARDSPSLPELFHNMRYEGHPALWFLLLWPVARLSANPVGMQVLHGTIAVCTVAIVLWRAPFTRIEKLLFPFGYFTLYEYAAKSREYALGFLLVVLICLAWHHRRSRPLRLAVLLALLANVHALFLLMSVAFVAALGIERLRTGTTDRAPSGPVFADFAALAIVLCGWAAAFATAWPPPDSGIAEGWFLHPSWSRLVTTLGLHGWSVSGALGIVTLGVAAAGVWNIRRQTDIGAFLALAIGMSLSFLYVKYPGYVWHRGVVFVAVIAGCWLSRGCATALFPRYALVLLLAAQCASGVRASWRDMTHPLSAGRAVARFLKDKGWSNDPLIGVPDYKMVTVLAYLRRDRAFYPYGDESCGCRDEGRWGSFTVWDRKRLVAPDDTALLQAAEKLGPSAIVVLPLEREGSGLLAHGFAQVGRFADATFFDETFALYRRAEGTGIPPGSHPPP